MQFFIDRITQLLRELFIDLPTSDVTNSHPRHQKYRTLHITYKHSIVKLSVAAIVNYFGEAYGLWSFVVTHVMLCKSFKKYQTFKSH